MLQIGDAKRDFPLNVRIRGSWNIFAISPAFLAGLFVPLIRPASACAVPNACLYAMD
jgi:hypothetical protein